MIESLAYQRRAGLPVEAALPLVFKAILVEVEQALDLTEPAVLAALGVSGDQLSVDPWWLARARGEESLTQAIGRALHAVGIQAVLFRSAHFAAALNLAVFPKLITRPSRLMVLRKPK